MTAQAKNLPVNRFVFTDGVVTIGEAKFRCHSAHSSYVINQIPITEITLMSDQENVAGLDDTVAKASGEDYPKNIQEIYAKLLPLKKGDNSTLTFKLTTSEDASKGTRKLEQEKVSVFTGVLLGWSPVWFSPKSLKFTVWLIHPLGMLDWASMFVKPIQGSGFDDYNVPPVIAEKDEIVPYMMGEYKDADVAKDLWKGVIKPELIKLCRAKRFDGEQNAEKMADYLENADNDKSESPLTWQIPNPQKVILDIRKTLYSAAMGRKSLWDALITLSNTYKFSVIARANDFSIAPVIPTLGGEDPKYSKMSWQDFSKRQEYNSLSRQITQSISMLRGTGGMPGYFDVKSKKTAQGLLALVDEPVTAGTDYVEYPAFLDFRYDPFFRTGATLGLKDEPLFASGYRLKDEALEVQTLNTQYNAFPEETLKKYAMVVMSERAFDGSSAVLYGNTSFDACPGSLVKIEPPLAGTFAKNSGFTVTTPVTNYYAHVWGVTIVFDASGKSSGTYVILSHIRMTVEQAALELTTHPLYNKRWVSTPVLAIDGYTAPAEAEGSGDSGGGGGESGFLQMLIAMNQQSGVIRS